MSNFFISKLAEVQTKHIGIGTRIWQFCVILEKAVIGDNCNICSHCFIENNVFIGNSVTIKNGVYIFDGVKIEDNVFIGPNVSFTNDKYPKSTVRFADYPITLVCKGASIGAGAVILPGIKIGENATIGAGSIVTKNVPPNSLVYGIASSVKKWLKINSSKY